MAVMTAQAQSKAGLWFSSTEGKIWQMQEAVLGDKVIGRPEIVLDVNETLQTFKGWGTCFNELGWDALMLLPEEEQQKAMRRMFAPDGDLRFTIGRIPVGASDYARGWYSCNETDGDFAMEHFTIDRDKEAVIPYIKFAQQYNPDMTFWGSPWSPPTWMKTNKHYAQRTGANNGLPTDKQVPPYFNDQFIMEPDYLQAYALYFSKFVDAYGEEGIPVTAIAYQNEAYSNTPYPGCSWTAKGTATFLSQYLGPYFAEHKPSVELILGTMNTASLDVYEEILSDPDLSKYVKSVGFQWEGRNAMPEVARRHPEYTLQQTESECGSGTFDWAAAQHTFFLINQYVGLGCDKYTYWNAVLKDNGSSTWGWIQNSLVQVNSATNTAYYTPEYYAFKHYSHFVEPGSVLLKGSSTDNNALVLAFRRPDDAIIIVAGNPTGTTRTITMDVDGKYLSTTLAPNSFNSFVFGDAGVQLEVLVDEAKALDVTGADAALVAELEEAIETGKTLAGSSDEAQIEAAIQTLKDVMEKVKNGDVSVDAAAERAALQTLYNKGNVMLAAAYAGAEAYEAALATAKGTLDNSAATGDELAAARTQLASATSEYLSTAVASASVPADFTGMIQNANFSDWANGWILNNVAASGDCKAWTVMGKTCYNNWSNNFTSLDIYQELEGLAPGLYELSCYSLCGPGEITDQHAYMTSGGVTSVSPAKTVGLWAAEGWEKQTTATIYVGEDGRMRIGYASTSGGGTAGWYCATDFTLSYLGVDTEGARTTLQTLLTSAEELLPQASLKSDKDNLQDAMDTAAGLLNGEELATLKALSDAANALETAMLDVRNSNAALSAYETARNEAETLKAELTSEDAKSVLQDLLDKYQEMVSAEDATGETVVKCHTMLSASAAYFRLLNEAYAYVNDAEGLYAEDAKLTLKSVIDEQNALLPSLTEAVAYENLVRQLAVEIENVRKTQLPGDVSDYTFAIRSADVETFGSDGLPEGWEISLTNGDAKVKNGQHYSGNASNHYFDSYNQTPGWLWFTGHQTITGLPNGTYTMQCMARTSGEGSFVTAEADGISYMEEIVKYGTEGNDGGPVWENAEEGSAEKAANGGKGYGWQQMEIGGIIVRNNTLTIGFTNDMYLTGKKWAGTWFSVDDFRLFYVSEKTTSVETAEKADDTFRVITGKGTIQVVSDEPYTIYNVSGVQIGSANGLPAGIYIVKCGGWSRKVSVK